MNIELLQRVRDQIAAHPEHFDLDNFAVFADEVGETGPVDGDKLVPINVCGTTFCIAGTAVALNDGPQARYYDYESRARQILGLNFRETESFFYAGSDSVWTSHADEFGWRIGPYGGVADWTQITAEQAVIILDRIISGEVTL